MELAIAELNSKQPVPAGPIATPAPSPRRFASSIAITGRQRQRRNPLRLIDDNDPGWERSMLFLGR